MKKYTDELIELCNGTNILFKALDRIEDYNSSRKPLYRHRALTKKQKETKKKKKNN